MSVTFDKETLYFVPVPYCKFDKVSPAARMVNVVALRVNVRNRVLSDYSIEDLDSGYIEAVSGKELLEKELRITIDEKDTAKIFIINKIKIKVLCFFG
ncbi:MAG: hypothetical protein ACRC2T_04550 [Thermoguttaceae bacterium]